MASLLDLDIESSYLLTQSPLLDRFERLPYWSPSPEDMSDKIPLDMAVNKSRFLSGADRKTEAANVPNAPLRQPVTPSYIPNNSGFANRVPAFHRSPPSLQRFLAKGNRSPPGHASAATSNTGSSFAVVSPVSDGICASICFSNAQLDSCYAFALHRGNGVYTRLIPADRLPPMRGLAQTQGP